MLFDSNVFNMIDWTVNGVEPCTGMYIRTIPIASLPSCQLQGPTLDLALRFNQFNANDYGFGVGWELTLTRVDVENGASTLILANGQRYRILSVSGNTVNLQYKNTLTFNCTTTGTGQYTIIYKNGFIEELVNYQIRTLTAPNNKKIYFNWYADQSFSIQDENQNRTGKGYMVSSTWQGTKHVVTTPRGSIAYETLIIANTRLRSLASVTTFIGIGLLELYTAKYQSHNEKYLYITDMASTIDSYQHDVIKYKTIMAPPGMPGSIYTVSSVEFNISGTYQKETFIKTIYSLSTANYTGYPQVTTWQNGVDNLESLPDSFSFSTTATTDNKRKILCSYNKFYLLLSEQPMAPEDYPDSNKPGKLAKYEYQLVANSGISSQSSTFMLPVTIKKIRQDYNTTTKQLQQISYDTQYRYDNYSNITRCTNPDGTVDDYTYYPSSGSIQQGIVYCPPDPGGFVNYLNKKTTTPFSNTPNYLRIYTYTYIAIANTNLIQPSEVTFSALARGQREILIDWTKEKHTYQTDTSSAFYGTLIKTAFTMLYGTAPSFTTTTTISTTASGNSINIINSQIGFDDTPSVPVKSSHVEVYAADTGDLMQSTDENNLTSLFSYDALGRPTKTIRPWGLGASDQATITTSYAPAAGETRTRDSRECFDRVTTVNNRGDLLTESYRLTTTDPKGVPTIKEFLMVENTYNTLLQLEKSITHDYSQDKKISLSATTNYQWNIFDELLSQKNPDMSNDSYTYDFLGNTISVLHQPGDSEIKSVYNNQGAIIKRTRSSNWKGKTVTGDVERFYYDGYWNILTHAHSQGETLDYTYDVLGRTLTQKGSTSGRKTYQYAPHTTAALVTIISVDDNLMGERRYDGLSREISSTVGKAITQSTYAGSTLLTQPRTVAINGGRTFTYTYNAGLNQLAARTVTPSPSTQDPSPAPTGSREYTFLQGSGLPASARNVTESHTREFGYDDFNNLASEKGNYSLPVVARRQPYKNTIISTVRGLPLKADVQLIDPDDARKTVIITKRYAYQSNGGFLVREEYLINNQLRSRTDYTRDETGNLTNLDIYGHVGDGSSTATPVTDRNAQYFARIRTLFSYAEFNLLKSRKHLCTKLTSPIIEQQLAYNQMDLLKKVITTTGGTHALSWTEHYKYTQSGSLSKWQKSGNINFQDPFSHWINSQSFSYSTSGNIMTIDAEHSTGRLRITYDYTDNITLGKITRQAIDSRGQPYGKATTVSYTTDSEGNVTFEATDEPVTRNETTYTYTGETNFSSIKKSSSTSTNYLNSAYHYDANDMILTIEKHPGTGQTEINCRYYLFNEVIAECIYIDKSRATTKLYNIFHRGNNETLMISSISPDQKITTYPCLNQSNGSQIAIGEYFPQMERMERGPLSRVYVPQYRFYLQGQNAYGFVFRTQSSVNLIFPMYKYNKKTDKMVETREIPHSPA